MIPSAPTAPHAARRADRRARGFMLACFVFVNFLGPAWTWADPAYLDPPVAQLAPRTRSSAYRRVRRQLTAVARDTRGRGPRWRQVLATVRALRDARSSRELDIVVKVSCE